MPLAVRQEVSRQLKKTQEEGIVQPFHSPWASPIVMVRKKDGSHRFCVDYRQLNAVTKLDTYPYQEWMICWTNLENPGSSLLFTTVDTCGGSKRRIKLLNRLGICSSPETAFQYRVQKRVKKGILKNYPSNSFMIASADNIGH